MSGERSRTGDGASAESFAPADPWAGERAEMPAREFDAVAYYVGRIALASIEPPPPALGVYLAADLTCADLAVVAALAWSGHRALARGSSRPTGPRASSAALLRRLTRG